MDKPTSAARRLEARVLAMAERHDPFASYYQGKDLVADWVGQRPLVWAALLKPYRGDIKDVLEIGSLEGRSALFWLNHLENCTLVCADTFKKPEVEGRFDRNIEEFGARVRKMKGPSILALGTLVVEHAAFDLIYVDGGHQRDTVMIDMLASWSLLRPGGIMLLDDYGWKPELAPEHTPKQAIDTFLDWHADAEIIFKSYQVAVRKAPATASKA